MIRIPIGQKNCGSSKSSLTPPPPKTVTLSKKNVTFFSTIFAPSPPEQRYVIYEWSLTMMHLLYDALTLSGSTLLSWFFN